mgnify:CR=1 FL=1
MVAVNLECHTARGVHVFTVLRTGPPPQQAASPAVSVDTEPAPQPQSAAVVRKRLCGRAPEGRIWHEGQWVDPRRVKGRATPVTDLTLKSRPRGQAPAGMKWDGQKGDWLSSRKGFHKRKASNPPPASENASPQVRRQRQRH